jgi:putative sterol carrier protein
VIEQMPGRFQPAACADLKARVHWTLTGEDPQEFSILIDRGTFRVEPGPSEEEADVRFETDSGTYLRLVNGDLRGIVAIMMRKLRVRGSLQLAATMDRVFV